MYDEDVANFVSPAIGNDVWNRRGLPGGADPYLRASPAIGNDVFSFRQRYDTAPTAAAGGDVTGTATFGQGSGTSAATASLNFTGAATYGQGSGTTDAAASLNFASTAEFGQGSGTTDGTASLNYAATAEFGQGAGTFDADVSSGSTPTPEPVPTYGHAGDWYDRKDFKRGLRKLRKRRKDLLPGAAKDRVVRTVSKKAGITLTAAKHVVEASVESLGADIEFADARRLATERTPVDEQQAMRIRAFWAAVAKYAAEMAEEDELLILLM